MTTLSKGYRGHAAPRESDDEKSPLLTLEDGVAPTLPILRPLGYGDVPNAVRTSYNAILDDALTRYLDDVDTVPGRALRQKISHGLSLSDHVSLHTGWTIGERGGDAILTLVFPGGKRGRLLPFFTPLLRPFDTEELVKRKKEFGAKVGPMLMRAFGDSIENLIEIQGLATAPEHQGKGYGTALMLLVNALADVQKRGVYLLTTDAHGFYQRFGYHIVAEDVLGADNPKWTGEPVHIRVMYRRPLGFPFPPGDSESEKVSR
ncbi:hypothetical protein VTO73DRAFT_3432 [Trametes versicolor]